MKFAIISDVHLGENCFIKGVDRKLGRHSKELLDKFVNIMNTKIKPDFVINLGDLIEDKDNKNDKKNYASGINILNKLECPLHNVVGNHELKHLKKSEIKRLSNLRNLYYSFDFKEVHIIILFSQWHIDRIIMDETQKIWLKNNLRKTKKKTLVFVHHPLADQSLKGNFWFEGRENKGLVSNRKGIRKILEDQSNSGKVIAVFNGHVHWNNLLVHNKIPYFTIQSLVENFNNKGIPAGAYAVCELNSRKIKCEVFGRDSCAMEYDF